MSNLLIAPRLVAATVVFVVTPVFVLFLLLLLDPVLMLRMVWIHVILCITGIAYWLLIATTFIGSILLSVLLVISLRCPLVQNHFVGIIEIKTAIAGG